jgi:hypothetical protein
VGRVRAEDEFDRGLDIEVLSDFASLHPTDQDVSHVADPRPDDPFAEAPDELGMMPLLDEHRSSEAGRRRPYLGSAASAGH